MCRYGNYGPYKSHLACFKCRKMFRRHGENLICPQCQGQMQNMGLDFKAPKQTNIKQWQKVELLAEHGITYMPCGCSGPGYRPKRLREVPIYLRPYNYFHPKFRGQDHSWLIRGNRKQNSWW